jgi:DUF2934 family protein
MPRKTKTEKAVENQVIQVARDVVPNQPASDETRARRTPTHEEISRRAHELWVMRGGVGGNAQEDWLRAERELRGR